jgi:hypothetical protein
VNRPDKQYRLYYTSLLNLPANRPSQSHNENRSPHHGYQDDLEQSLWLVRVSHTLSA